MNEFIVSNMGNAQPYPMYFTVNGKDNAAEGQIITGKGTATIVHIEPIAVGDTIQIAGIVHEVSEITETKKPKGKGHPVEAILYSINTTYKRMVTHR